MELNSVGYLIRPSRYRNTLGSSDYELVSQVFFSTANATIDESTDYITERVYECVPLPANATEVMTSSQFETPYEQIRRLH